MDPNNVNTINNDTVYKIYKEFGKKTCVEKLLDILKNKKQPLPTIPAIYKSVDSLVKKYKSLEKNKNRKNNNENFDHLKSTQFKFPVAYGPLGPRQQHVDTSKIMCQAYATAVMSVSEELVEAKLEVDLTKRKLDESILENKCINENIKKIKHEHQQNQPKLIKAVSLQKLNKMLSKTNNVLRKKLSKHAHRVKLFSLKLKYYKKKIEKVEKKEANVVNIQYTEDRNDEYIVLTEKLQEKDVQIRGLIEENEWLRNLVEDNKLIETFDEKRKRYTPELQKCVYSLLDNNVSASKIGPVINSCLKLAEREASKIPSKSTVLEMNVQRLALAHEQISDTFTKKETVCLMTDETSKFGNKYMGYEARDDEGTFWVLGLREITTKSSQDTLKVLREILDDIDYISDSTNSEQSKLILKHMVATMSDRAATETKFNRILQEYRENVLPLVRNVYGDLTDDEGIKVSALSNFFCGLHSLVHIADTSDKSLLTAEKAIFGDNDVPRPEGSFTSKTESGTTRLVRTASKAFSSGGDEKSGCFSGFSVFVKPFLKQHKFQTLPLQRFRGARFNILFANAASVYFLHKEMIGYLQQLGATNRLLKAVLNDLQTPEFIAGTKCLGLVSKLLTCPLWNVIENRDIDIVEMNVKYLEFVQVIEEASRDVQAFLTGALAFGNYANDCILEYLLQPSQVDGICSVMLEILLPAISMVCRKLFADHLPGGCHSQIDPNNADIRSKLKCVPKSNVFAESIFGRLDQILRQKPSITTISSEAYIMFSNNKTMQWLQSKDTSEQDKLLAKARREGRHISRKFKERKELIFQERRAAMEESIRKTTETKRKKEQQLEQYTNEMIEFSLRQTQEDVENQVKSYSKQNVQIKALKAQLNFRQKVLQQESDDKSVFNFTKVQNSKRVNLSVHELTVNVKKLVNKAMVKGITGQRHILVGRRVRHKFADDTWYDGKVLSQVNSSECLRVQINIILVFFKVIVSMTLSVHAHGLHFFLLTVFL